MRAPAETSSAAEADLVTAQDCLSCPVAAEAFCARLGEPGRNYYRRHVTRLWFGRNTPILTAGRPRHRLLILAQGVMRLSRARHNGSRQVLAFHFPGDIVSYGDYETVWDTDLETVTESRLCSLEFAQAETLRRLCPDLDRLLLNTAQEQIREQQRHLLDLGRTTALQRLAALLLALEKQARGPDMAPDCFTIPMSRADIADYLILQVETISRCFAKLVEQGALELPKPTKVKMLDRQLLRDLGDGVKA